jgi:hypothetical protein
MDQRDSWGERAMGRLIARILWSAALVSVAGCAATYNPPRARKEVLEEKMDAEKGQIYRVAIHVLRRSGFRFAFADLQEGRITTRAKTMKLTDKECDCGTAMGRMFASDSRTTTQYVASDTSMVKRFHCVSRGTLEREMLDKIKDGLAESESAATETDTETDVEQ